jgi:hypothetical protein
MTWVSWSAVRGLNPTPPEARTWLNHELQGSDYQSPWLDSLTRWIADQMRKLLEGSNHLAGLSAAITGLIALVVIALLVWILPRVRRERASTVTNGAVLDDGTITADAYRELATRAIREGRFEDAVLDGFRAIAKDMSNRGMLDDAPSCTAHEVSMALASNFPEQADRLARAADLFDSVRYGQRPMGAYQAGQIQALDTELVTVRPLPMTSVEELPV